MYKIIDEILKNKVIGIGTGKTINKFIKNVLNKLESQHIKNLIFVPTSYETHELLNKYEFCCKELQFVNHIDLYIDSADYFDRLNNLIKGLGGAFLKEKIAMTMAKKSYILVNKNKFLENFDNVKVPVEIVPSSYYLFKSTIECEILISSNIRGPVYTENGNFIVFVDYSNLSKINCCGVLDNGYFEYEKYKHEIVMIPDNF